MANNEELVGQLTMVMMALLGMLIYSLVVGVLTVGSGAAILELGMVWAHLFVSLACAVGQLGLAPALPEAGGAFTYLRDVVDALSQRWNRYVIGYDVRTQSQLFDSVSAWYARTRTRAGITSGPAEKLTRAPVVAACILLISVLAYALWRRRSLLLLKEPLEPGETRPSSSALTAAQLYQGLELALTRRGLSRPFGTPPLFHAETLVAQGHPLAEEVLDLTRVYLAYRFGKEPLPETGRKDFLRRISAIASASSSKG